MTFDELIAQIDSGQFNSDLTHELRELTVALNARAQEGGAAKGALTIKLAFVAANNGRVEIAAEATAKRPGPRKTTETRWIGKRGELAASDPRQDPLPLRTAGAPANDDAPLRTPRG